MQSPAKTHTLWEINLPALKMHQCVNGPLFSSCVGAPPGAVPPAPATTVFLYQSSAW